MIVPPRLFFPAGHKAHWYTCALLAPDVVCATSVLYEPAAQDSAVGVHVVTLPPAEVEPTGHAAQAYLILTPGFKKPLDESIKLLN